MKKYAFANSDGGLYCSKTHILEIDDRKHCNDCPHKEECEEKAQDNS